jgi:hypothetical protein
MLQDGVESFEDASRDDFVSRLGAGFSAAQPVLLLEGVHSPYPSLYRDPVTSSYRNGKFCVTGVKVLADHDHMHTTISYMFR